MDIDPNKTSNRAPRAPRPHQRLLTLSQISLEFGVPRTSTLALIRSGALPSVRLGERRIWIRRQDIEQLIERSTERVSA
jgi:excisionase family DNA binding protein